MPIIYYENTQTLNLSSSNYNVVKYHIMVYILGYFSFLFSSSKSSFILTTLVKRIPRKEKEAVHEFVYARGTHELLSAQWDGRAVQQDSFCLYICPLCNCHVRGSPPADQWEVVV